MKTQTVLDYLRELAPLTLAEDWDNVGLLIGSEDRDLQRVMTCLTLTPDVAQEAVDTTANLIITHHPVLFRAVQRLTDGSSEGKLLLALIEAGIAVYSPHTSYDSAIAGINQQLAELFELSAIQPLRLHEEAEQEDSSEQPPGSGRYGDLADEVLLSEFVSLVKDRLAIENTQFVGEPDTPVRRVGIACGAAAEFMHDADRLGCQVLLTGEARFHACLESRSRGMALVLPGHYATERPAMENLARILSDEFPDVTVAASEVESDPVRFA